MMYNKRKVVGGNAMTHVVKFNNVSFRYNQDGPWVLKNCSFTINTNESVAIIGHNGSGKSTIAKLMNGLLLPEKGDIIINGHELNEQSIWEIRRHVGMVFQNPDNQFVGATVQDDVAFGMENNGIPRDIMIERINKSLRAVRMEDYKQTEPYRLSGGQKQRVAIAGVLAVSPEILILDEATVMLDPKGRTDIMETIANVTKRENLTLIAITHDLYEATQVDRIIVLNEGEIEMIGTPGEIFAKQTMLQQMGLDIPFIVELNNELKQLGIQLQENALNYEQLLEELWTLHLKT